MDKIVETDLSNLGAELTKENSELHILELLEECENSKELFNSVAKIINCNDQLYRIVISKINKHYDKPSK